jgi:hypothetical protein
LLLGTTLGLATFWRSPPLQDEVLDIFHAAGLPGGVHETAIMHLYVLLLVEWTSAFAMVVMAGEGDLGVLGGCMGVVRRPVTVVVVVVIIIIVASIIVATLMMVAMMAMRVLVLVLVLVVHHGGTLSLDTQFSFSLFSLFISACDLQQDMCSGESLELFLC